MGRIEKTVFVSYRRADESWGLAIFQNLTQHGYDVFIDYDGIASGNFETVILENIRARAHFLVLLTPTALERCGDPKDWMRREIEAALDSQRNIVPLMLGGFDFDTPAIASQLTGKLAVLKEYNGLEIPKARFFSSEMERLRSRFLNVPVDAVLHSTSPSAQQAALEQKVKAIRAAGEQHDEFHESKVRPWLIGGGAVGVAVLAALWVFLLPQSPALSPPQAPTSPPPVSSPAPGPKAPKPPNGDAISKLDYPFRIYFAGTFYRDEDILVLNSKLGELGWAARPPDPKDGQIRTDDAKGKREVRYGSANDKAAAELLALDVEKLASEKAVGRLSPGPFKPPQLTPGIPSHNLEIWISN
jgi:hypothetical protein